MNMINSNFCSYFSERIVTIMKNNLNIYFCLTLCFFSYISLACDSVSLCIDQQCTSCPLLLSLNQEATEFATLKAIPQLGYGFEDSLTVNSISFTNLDISLIPTCSINIYNKYIGFEIGVPTNNGECQPIGLIADLSLFVNGTQVVQYFNVNSS
eukprot:TRINITY_DN6418_c0_g1_i1.p1 TRINITY_DN6418_c0_g1~~TRINITY_DN6418_c0_g1_i1.p1  ORF type:complete len:154 (+),score=1.28 TRINITY_DN6418_c0_g1_i1:75-536(+)